MAITKTGAMFKSFTFDGEDSRNYGIYITGEPSFNAPERAVEMVTIPGRNGAFAMDQGHFENIEVTYPAGIFADDESTFADAVSNLRNMLCSRKGYCRLTDDYNPNEYRMAIYKSGLEVDTALMRAGEFDITFECKPQRFLTSGETKTTLSNPATVTNPTLFDSHPMLEVYGFGAIDINGEEINVISTYLGNVIVLNPTQMTYTGPLTVTIDDQYANMGDTITVSKVGYPAPWRVDSGYVLNTSSSTVSGDGTVAIYAGAQDIFIDISSNEWTFTYGTSSTKTVTASLSLETSVYGTITGGSVGLSLAYDGADKFTLTVSQTVPSHFTQGHGQASFGTITLYSTQSALGNPVYIDLDIGEAYKTENGSTVSVNDAVQIPPDLPLLKSGSNTISYDNTFTKIDLIPRWWKI